MTLSAGALSSIVVAYLLGSIPFGLILTRLAGLGDIRRIGSGNIGATNVLRTGNTKLAALTLVLDASKGAAAVMLGWSFGPDGAAWAAVAVVIGHMFPIWLRFKGGKGVAPAGGALLAYVPLVGVAAGVTWLAVILVTRYSSLSAIVATLLAPLYAWLVTHDPRATGVVLAIALLVLWRHRANMQRLVRGEESRISLHRREAR